MKRAHIDVEIAVEYGEVMDMLATTRDKNTVATALVERTRGKAEEEAAAVGGYLDMSRAPEFYIRRGSKIPTPINPGGGDWMLVASRWPVEVPENFDPQRAAALTR